MVRPGFSGCSMLGRHDPGAARAAEPCNQDPGSLARRRDCPHRTLYVRLCNTPHRQTSYSRCLLITYVYAHTTTQSQTVVTVYLKSRQLRLSASVRALLDKGKQL